MRCASCNGYGDIIQNVNAGDFDWPYACTYCDADRLPERWKHYSKREGYRRPLTRREHFKMILGGKDPRNG